MLAIHEAVKLFKNILLRHKFSIQKHCKSNTQHVKLEAKSDIVKRRLADLAEFNHEFEYIEGKTNPADYVSRNINNVTTDANLHNNLFKVKQALSNETSKANSIMIKNSS